MSTQEQAPAKGALKKTRRGEQPAPAATKVYDKTTVRIEAEVLARAKAAHRLMYGKSLQKTFSEFAEEAFAREAARIEAEHNDGEPLQPWREAFAPGRKV